MIWAMRAWASSSASFGFFCPTSAVCTAVAIVSPEAPKEQRVETFGMTWDDLLAWFKSEREKRLEAVVGGEPYEIFLTEDAWRLADVRCEGADPLPVTRRGKLRRTTRKRWKNGPATANWPIKFLPCTSCNYVKTPRPFTTPKSH